MSDSTETDRRYTRQSKTIPLRPLKGIHRNVSSTLVPTGAFTDVNGFLPTDSGLYRRYDFRTLDMVFPDVLQWNHISSFIDDRGVKVTFGIGDGVFYELAGSGFVPRPNVYPNTNSSAGGTVSATAGSRELIGESAVTLWEDEGGFVRGDTITITTDSPSAGDTVTYTIDNIGGNETLTIIEVPLADIVDKPYYVTRYMTPAPSWVIQTVRLDRLLYIVTGKNTVMVYNIDEPSNVYTYWEVAKFIDSGYVIPASPNFIPKCIEVFKDRVWTGNMFSDKDDRWYTTRVSWTPILSPLHFMPDDHYVDLISVGGEVSAIKSLGNLLGVYFEFGIQYGRETAIPGDTLPLGFDKVETARRGVLQPDAVASARGGHFFVSTDNVHFLGENLQLQELAGTVKELMFRPAMNKSRYKIQNFFEAEGLSVCASQSEAGYDEVWAYNFDTKEWTRFDISADYATMFALGSRLTYADFDPGQIYSAPYEGWIEPDTGLPHVLCNDQIWDTTRDPTTKFFTNYNVRTDDMSNGLGAPLEGVDIPFYSYLPVNAENRILAYYSDCLTVYGGSSNVSASDKFFITTGKFIHSFENNDGVDYNGSPVSVMVETGDFDMGLPDTYKTFYKIAFRLDERAANQLNYRIEASNDSGLTWGDLGTLVVMAGGKEGRCNFIYTGSAARFRLSSNTASPSYRVIEMTIDVRIRGRQFGDF